MVMMRPVVNLVRSVLVEPLLELQEVLKWVELKVSLLLLRVTMSNRLDDGFGKPQLGHSQG